MELENRLGAEVYEYCGYQIPIDLGQPKLSIEEIDNLIAEKNYKKISKAIKTLPDLIAYLDHSNFSIEDIDIKHFDPVVHITDTGTVTYDDEDLIYTLGGYEILKIGYSQCSGGTSLFHYLLKDTYDEIGYVILNGVNGKGHALNYIKQNNKYFLINPVDYFEKKHLWIDNGHANCCADSLEELINNLKNTSSTFGCGNRLIKLYTVISPGVMVSGNVNKGNDPDIDLFAIGEKVICWIDHPYCFVEPKHNWLNEEIELGYFSTIQK